MRKFINLIKKTHDFLVNRDKVKAELYWIRKIWYLILLIVSTIYVIMNFTTFINLCFACHFNGNSIIFILWIILLLMPLIDSIEGYGFKFNKDGYDWERQSNELKKLREEVLNNDNYPNIDDLKSKLEKIGKEKSDE